MDDEIDLKRFFTYVQNRKKTLICIAFGFFLLANIVFFSFYGMVYSSMGKVQLSSEATNEKITAYKDLILSDSVIETAIKKSTIDANKSYVRKNLSISANMGSELYSISLNYKDREDGNRLCSFIINEFINRVEAYDGVDAYLYDQVVTSDTPINFNAIKSELLYAIIGSALSIGYAFILFYYSNKIKGEKCLEKYNLLGIINKNNSLIKTKIILSDPGKVIFLNTPKNINCKNEIFDLIKEFSKDQKVLFIDTNVRDKSKKSGYSDLLTNYKEDVSKYIKSDKFDIMECGTINNEVEVLLSNKNNKKLISDLRKKYDYIILYNSNIVDYSDSLILSKLCDCNYIVVGINQTDKRDFEKSLEAYRQINTDVNGIIAIDKKEY